MPPLIEQLKQAFIDDLVAGRIRSGERLGEESLGMRWNVSRVPIREMFVGLESDGLLERRPNQGTFVRHVGSEELEEMWSLRTAIENLVVRRAAQCATPAQIKKLRKLADAVDDLHCCRDATLVVRTELAFHTYLCEVGRMRYAARMTRLQQLMMHCMTIGLGSAELIEPPDEHRLLTAAIASGDPQQAGELHLKQADAALGRFVNLGFFAPFQPGRVRAMNSSSRKRATP